ncbi:GH39 family glycosyl hydrolase [Hymenobacter bucti]|uniref:Glycosyl hydrolases family 39 N-terminal catalytic domain-containing protein n=1 Tax=Hymenobacter bucti TaxID=1844114 RepID=A0ABW4QVT7_9BACT
MKFFAVLRTKTMVILLLASLLVRPPQSWAQQRTIEVNLQAIKGKLSPTFNACIGAGRANEGLRADWQQQLAQIKHDAGFRYIRMHGLLTDDMGLYRVDAQGKEHYNFQYIDVLYDYLLSIHVKPFVELGFMPSALASGDKTIFWWRGNVTPPRSYEQWGKLIEALTQHFTARYGAAEVSSWYFEVWNEPNLAGFWTGSQADYFQLYRYAASAIKRVDARYQVGGPATAGAAWIPEMITFCTQNQVPLDFVSTHTYGVEQGFLDEFGTTGTVLSKDEQAVSGDVQKNRLQIQQSARPTLALHYTEWSSSYTPADPTHDSYHQAAYILQKLKQVGNTAQSMSYWVFSDIFEEAGPRSEAFHGGFGLMNTQGIKKPAYFAYQYLNELFATELKSNDGQSLATTDGQGNLRLLLWDYTRTLPDGLNNQQYFIKDLPAKDKGNATIQVKGLRPGVYLATIAQVGYKRNDAYTAYIGMGSPAQLSKQQVTSLKAQATGKAQEQRKIRVNADGGLRLTLPLRENDVYLLKLQLAS